MNERVENARTPRLARKAVVAGVAVLAIKRLVVAAGVPTSMWLFPVLALLGWIAYLSPPIAAALFTMGMPLFGLQSGGVPILTLLLITTVLCALGSRIVRVQLRKLMCIERTALYSLFGLVVVLVLGSWQGLLSSSDAVVQHNINILRYWLGFLVIGLVCCLSFKEFHAFLAATAIFYVAVVLYLPVEAYGGVIRKAVFEPTIFDAGARYGTMNPNTLAQVSALCGVIAIAFVAGTQGFKRLGFGIIVLTSFGLGLLSGAKQGAVAWFLGVAMVILVLSRKRVKHLVVFFGVVLLLAISLTFVAERLLLTALLARYQELLMAPGAWESLSYIERAELFRNSFEKFFASPVMGSGFGVGMEEVHETEAESGSRIVYVVGSHNILIDLLQETGLIGFVVFLLSVGGIIIGFFQRLAAAPFSSQARLTRAAATGALMVTVVTMMISGGMETAFLPMLLGGMAGATRSVAKMR